MKDFNEDFRKWLEKAHYPNSIVTMDMIMDGLPKSAQLGLIDEFVRKDHPPLQYERMIKEKKEVYNQK